MQKYTDWEKPPRKTISNVYTFINKIFVTYFISIDLCFQICCICWCFFIKKSVSYWIFSIKPLAHSWTNRRKINEDFMMLEGKLYVRLWLFCVEFEGGKLEQTRRHPESIPKASRRKPEEKLSKKWMAETCW